MRLWSKGLGRLILPFHLEDHFALYPEGDFLVIEGRIVEKKVNWIYRIHLGSEDMVRFIAFMANTPLALSFLKTYWGYRGLFRIVKRILFLPFLFLWAWVKSPYKYRRVESSLPESPTTAKPSSVTEPQKKELQTVCSSGLKV
jgi:hypothetical protein